MRREFMGGSQDELADRRSRRERDKLLAQRLAEASKRAAPVLSDLRRAAFNVNGIGDLIELQQSEYLRAVPVLLRWLGRTDDPFLKSGIARTLSSKAAKPLAGVITPALIEAFRSFDVPANDTFGAFTIGTCKWTIGNAIDALADDRFFEELAEIVQDKSERRARQMVVYRMGKMKDPRAVHILIDLLEDDEVVVHAAHALGQLKAMEAKPFLQQLVTHPFAYKEAKKALTKIERAEEKARRKR